MMIFPNAMKSGMKRVIIDKFKGLFQRVWQRGVDARLPLRDHDQLREREPLHRLEVNRHGAVERLHPVDRNADPGGFAGKQRDLHRFRGEAERGREIELERARQLNPAAALPRGRRHFDPRLPHIGQDLRHDFAGDRRLRRGRVRNLGVHAGAALALLGNLSAADLE